MKDKCDKCNSEIISNKCSCGKWFPADSIPENVRIFKAAIEEYNKMNMDTPLSIEDIGSGSASIFFKGDCELCEKIKAYIESFNSKNGGVK